MKVKKIFLSTLLLCALTYTSCTNDDSSDNTSEDPILASTLTTDEINTNLSIDLAMDDIAIIVNDQVEAKLVDGVTKNILSTPTPPALPAAYTSILPACAASGFIDTPVTVGTTTTTTRTITITFGTATSACVFRGHNLKGQIILNHTYNSFTPATTKYVMVSFNNFSINGNTVEGTATSKRDMIGTGATLHPKYTLNTVNTSNAQTPVITPADIKYTTSAGVYIRNGWFTKETTSGYATRTDLTDDINLTDVAYVTSYPSGYLLSSFTIAGLNTPLVFNTACGLSTNAMSFAGTGTLFMTKGSHSAVIKYGTGACDNLARIAIDIKLSDYFVPNSSVAGNPVQYNSNLYVLYPAGTTPPTPAEIYAQVTTNFNAKFDAIATPITLSNN